MDIAHIRSQFPSLSKSDWVPLLFLPFNTKKYSDIQIELPLSLFLFQKRSSWIMLEALNVSKPWLMASSNTCSGAMSNWYFVLFFLFFLSSTNSFFFFFSSQGASYEVSQEASRKYHAGSEAMRLLLNAEDVSEVVCGSSSTVVVSNFARAIGPTCKPGQEIIVTDTDHECKWSCLVELWQGCG